jgi:hypothetical protein
LTKITVLGVGGIEFFQSGLRVSLQLHGGSGMSSRAEEKGSKQEKREVFE